MYDTSTKLRFLVTSDVVWDLILWTDESQDLVLVVDLRLRLKCVLGYVLTPTRLQRSRLGFVSTLNVSSRSRSPRLVRPTSRSPALTTLSLLLPILNNFMNSRFEVKSRDYKSALFSWQHSSRAPRSSLTVTNSTMTSSDAHQIQ